MKAYDPDRPLLSLHVPKCAGTSFRVVLRKWFGLRLYLHYVNEKKGRPPRRRRLRSRLFPTRWKRRVCVHGHFNNKRPGYGVRDYYPDVDQFITILRDPFELHASHYFWKKRLGEKLFIDGEARPLPPADAYGVDRHFAETPSFLRRYIPFDLTLDNYQSVLDENYVYIGVAEDLQATVNILAERLGCRPIKIDWRNVSPRNEPISESVRQDFIARHPLEYAIYNYALERYKQ